MPPVLFVQTPALTNGEIGAAKAIANVGIGMNNLTHAFTGKGNHIEPFQPSNVAQEVGMVITERVTFFGGLIGGRAQVGGVLVAETKTRAQVAAGVGNAERSAVAQGSAAERTIATAPYVRPSGATTPAQRASVQGKPCSVCGESAPRMNAGHKEALVKEYYRTGTINRANMRSPSSVRPECPHCSNVEGGHLSHYSRVMKNQIPQ